MSEREDATTFMAGNLYRPIVPTKTYPLVPLDFLQRARVSLDLLDRRIREWLLLDSKGVRFIVAWALWLAGMSSYRFGNKGRGFSLLCRLHRAALNDTASRSVEQFIRSNTRSGGPLLQVIAEQVRSVGPTDTTAKYFDNPERMLKSGAIVLKSPGVNERGVLMLYYLYIYPIFTRFFDLESIAQRYHIVLEPSWSGFCDPSILNFLTLHRPVFVGSVEPRDTAFLNRVSTALVPVSVSSNTWVDSRVFRPLFDVGNKDIDVVMVAGWGKYKRHWAFFRALRTLRRSGRSLRVALVGYHLGEQWESIYDQAKYFGVQDLLEIYNDLTQSEVNQILNRTKVHILWARREGVNRAIIEAMFANVPSIVRRGFNYGHEYNYINPNTGRFASESELPETLWEMTQTYSDFSPLRWVQDNMTCQHSTRIVTDAVGARARSGDESWTGDLAVKVNGRDGMTYWDPADEERFAADYQFLKASRRT